MPTGMDSATYFLSLAFLVLKYSARPAPTWLAASHHKDGKQVIDTLGSAVRIVEHSVDRRERLMQATETSGKKPADRI